MSDYLLPAFLAVLVHMAALLAVAFAWMPASASRMLVRPPAIEATLVVLRPEDAPAPKPQSGPPRQGTPAPARRETGPPPAPRPAPPAAIRPEAEPKATVHARRQSADDARRAARERLAAESLDLALAHESQAMERERAARTAAELAESYAARISRAIEQNWKRPPSARNGMHAVLLIDLVPTGEVVAVRIVESSGNAAFDRSAERAVERLGKLEVPDDPRIFERYFRRLRLEFQPEDLMR